MTVFTEAISVAITLILADDHPMTRAGLAFWLERTEGFILLGEAGDGTEAWRLIEKHEPDAALMDIEMPLENGISVTRRIRQARLKTAVLMLTSYKAKQYIIASLQAGASGFILKTASLDELEKAIVAVSRGEFYIDPAISDLPEPSTSTTPLSQREKEVLVMTAQGMSGREISGELGISERTVEAHLGAVYNKFGAKNKTEAILMALKSGILLLDELVIGQRNVLP
jgi:DNA-binding NarL/FixJ family response regulator